MCNPLIDITMEVEDRAFLDRYQIRPGNAILAEEPVHQRLIEEVWKRHFTDKQIVVAPGGSGLNTIRAANVRNKLKLNSMVVYAEREIP
jgi:hypothetical protein